MDPPAAKKRRLAPKEPSQPQPSFPPHEPASQPQPQPQPQHYPVQEPAQAAPPPPERHEFESFARHLQDAAMLIHRQSQKSPYTNVSVLIIQWEEEQEEEEQEEPQAGDESTVIDPELTALEQVFRDRYNYRTERWSIPVVPTASVKLGVRMQAFLEKQAPDHLLIVYYTGHACVGLDNQLFWTSNSTETAAKLRWDGFRCLFDDSPSDMLFLLDTCMTRDVALSSNGASLKQSIAANGLERSAQDFQGRSFTALLTDALLRLSTGRPFTADHLWHEVAYHRQQELLQNSGLTNGASKGGSLVEKLPILQTLNRGTSQTLSLAPLATRADPNTQADGEAPAGVASLQEHAIPPQSVAGLTFDEARVLVCTTFVGEASPDMSSFHQWLHTSPGAATKIVVEGIFLGPPTMLLISMPVSVWNVVQHDKVCCFLGYITSRNLTHLYKRIVGSASPLKVSPEDGRILLEAREAASTTPVVQRHEYSHENSNYAQRFPETPIRLDGSGRMDSTSLSQPSKSGVSTFANSTPVMALVKQDEVEDSAEMQEAAEQLKALSHVRHVSDEIAAAQANSTLAELTPEIKRDGDEINEPGLEEAQQHTPSAKPKPRRSLAKVASKQETRCDLCSHAPFKDSSSLRKHVAAAHTRPFPCAFAFAGCTSTFGSKNEWKRHIASQHLCLTYYRCSSCPQSSVEGKGNEFNRKDLFTQHLRRMHAPFAIKKAIAKGDSKLQVEWETHVKDMQSSCLITRRRPPQRSACPKPDCASVFEGPTSWDEWTEHVGRHMEKGEAARLGVDRLLAKWALEEGVIERKEDGEYKLCSGPGSGAEKESNHKSNGAGNHSDENSRDSEGDTTAAVGAMIADKMEIDG